MTDLLEIHQYDGVGYQPLVFFDGWQAALLNWEPLFDLAHAGEPDRRGLCAVARAGCHLCL
jgi:hypothetical protein